MKLSNNFGPFSVFLTNIIYKTTIGFDENGNEITTSCNECGLRLNYKNSNLKLKSEFDVTIPSSELFFAWFHFLINVMTKDDGKFQYFNFFDDNYGIKSRMIDGKFEFFDVRGELEGINEIDCIRAPLIYGLSILQSNFQENMKNNLDLKNFTQILRFDLSEMKLPEIEY